MCSLLFVLALATSSIATARAQEPRVEPGPLVGVPERPPTAEEPCPADPRVESALLDQEGKTYVEPPPPDFARLGAFVPDRALHGVLEDGSPVVRGSAYKARFPAGGASYAPYFGSDAPRTWPVEMRLAHVSIEGTELVYDEAATATREGEQVRYERGSLVERYEIGRDTIEQVFVFEDLPARGELVLRIDVTTDLEARATSEWIEFANERGAVRYGHATALDASGASIAAATTLIGDEIEIRVPAEFVAKAQLPLVVDPVISTFAVGPSGSMVGRPDCAYDATFGRWLVVWTDRFSELPSDTGIAWRLFGTFGGATIASGYLGADKQWKDGVCANSNASNQFLVVARRTNQIVGQAISAASGAVGQPFVVATMNGNPGEFDVGGDPYPTAPSYFLVTWHRSNEVTTPPELRYRLVGTAGPVGPEQTLWSDPDDEVVEVALSKSNGGTNWNVVWVREQLHDHIVGARISWNGTLLPGFTQVKNNGQIRGVAASPPLYGSETWAVGYANDEPGEAFQEDVYVALLNGSTLLHTANLSLMVELSGGGIRVGNQFLPEIDSDGRSFAISYLDHHDGGVHVATVAPVGNRLHLSEVQTIEYGDSFWTTIASTNGSGLAWRLQLAVYEAPGSEATLAGALYDNALYTSYCHPGYDGVTSCPCGNPPAQYGRGCNNAASTGGAKLYGTGISSVGSDSMSLISLNLPTNQTVLFYQGTSPLTSAVFVGKGMRCVGGTLLNLYSKTSQPLSGQAYATAPNPGDVKIAARSAQLGYPIQPGQTRHYFASYRPIGTSGGGNGMLACANGVAANATQSLQAIWIP